MTLARFANAAADRKRHWTAVLVRVRETRFRSEFPRRQGTTGTLDRNTKALRSALREYYPAALEAFESLSDRDALAVLGRAPTRQRPHD